MVITYHVIATAACSFFWHRPMVIWGAVCKVKIVYGQNNALSYAKSNGDGKKKRFPAPSHMVTKKSMLS